MATVTRVEMHMACGGTVDVPRSHIKRAAEAHVALCPICARLNQRNAEFRGAERGGAALWHAFNDGARRPMPRA